MLRSLSQDDPLQLRARVVRRIRARFLLMDAESVLRRTLVHAAHDARGLGPEDVLEDWIAARIDRAIDELASASLEPGSALGPWSELARPLGLDARAMARGSVRFNACSLEARRAFFLLVLGGASLEDCAARSGVTAVELAQAARTALQVLLDEAGTTRRCAGGGAA